MNSLALLQHVAGRHQPVHVVGAEVALAELVAVDAGLGAEQPLGQFDARLFQADEEDAGRRRPADRIADDDVADDVQREGRFADRRPGREDDQLAVLQAGRQLVEVDEAGRQAGPA